MKPRRHARVDDFDRPALEELSAGRLEVARQQLSGFLQRALRGRKADALQGLGSRTHRFESLQRQEQVRPALGRQKRVNFVDDHRLQRGKVAPGLRSEQQVK